MSTVPFASTLDEGMQTHQGQKRKRNEDCYGSFHSFQCTEEQLAEKGYLYLVADGMGGHDYGDQASHMAVDIIVQSYYQRADSDLDRSLCYAITDANQAIYNMAQELRRPGGRSMGTTAVCAVFLDDTVIVANVGDSRAYLLRDGTLKLLTQDHSWVAEQMRLHNISYEAALRRADEEGTRNSLVRVLGVQPDVEVDIGKHPWRTGDTLLLCSDGLYSMIDERTIEATLNQYAPPEAVDHLIELANAAGGYDNITALVVQAASPSPPDPWALIGGRLPKMLVRGVLALVLFAILAIFIFNGMSPFTWAQTVPDESLSPGVGVDLDTITPGQTPTPLVTAPTATPLDESLGASPETSETTDVQQLPNLVKPATTTPTPLPPTLTPVLSTRTPVLPTRALIEPTAAQPPDRVPVQAEPTASSPLPSPTTELPPAVPAPPPPPSPTQPSQVTIPNVINMLEGEAFNILVSHRLGVETVSQGTNCNPYVVVGIHPPVGTVVHLYDVVQLSVCPAINVPNAIGLQREAAETVLRQAGLTVQVIEHPDNKPNNQVWSTAPGPGSVVGPGTLVTMNVWVRQGSGHEQGESGVTSD